MDAQLEGVEVNPGDDELQCYLELRGRLRCLDFWPFLAILRQYRARI